MTLARHLPRAAVLAGICALAAGGIGMAIITGQPASTTTPEVQLAQPAADSPPTTDTTTPEAVPSVVTQDVARAETAAGRAETAAVRAEVAATHVDQIIATTTTTTAAAAPAATTTTIIEPLVEVSPTTTITTMAPKRWVEVGRFPIDPSGDGPPGQIVVTLHTGQIRVTGMSEGAVWLGDVDPTVACDAITAPRAGTIIETANGCPPRTDWPTGTQTLSGGRLISGLTFKSFTSSRPVVVEEYR